MTERELDVAGWGAVAGFGAAYLWEGAVYVLSGGPLLDGIVLVGVCAFVVRAGIHGARTRGPALGAAGGSDGR